MQILKLRPHQKKAVKESKNKWGLWFRMRVGKTPTAIKLVTSRAKSGLIICPKGLVKQWEKEIEVWKDKDIPFRVISRDQFRTKFSWSKRGKHEYVSGCELEEYDAICVDECFTGETEILTEKGFIEFSKLNKNKKVAQYNIKNKNISFIKPDEHIEKQYNGKMISVNSRDVDINATENHEVIIHRKTTVDKIPIKDIKRSHKIPLCGYSSYEENFLNPWEKLMIALQADGSIHKVYKKNNNSSLLFSFSKKNKIKEFLKLMEDGRFAFNEIKAQKKIGNTKRRRRFIVRDIENSSKRIRDSFTLSELSLKKCREIIDYMVIWDGYIQKNGQYYYSNTDEDSVSFYQEVSVLSGYRARKGIQIDSRKESYNDIHRLYILKNRQLQDLQATNKKEFNYNGKVYCVRVKEGNILIRRNGKIAVVGNCHRGFGNYKSKMFKCLDAYIKLYNTKYLWLLSGTPFTATSWSVYSYGKLLGQDWKWFSWDKEFFHSFGVIKKPKEGKEKQLQNVLRQLGTVVDLKDVAEVADDVDIIEEFTLNTAQKKYISEIDEDLPITEYIKQHQLEQGVLKSDGYSRALSFPCSKDKRLVEIAANYDKIIIVARYLYQINKYKELFKNRKVYEISGQVKETASEVAEKAEASDNCIVIIQSDTCDGYNLKSFDTMIFSSMSYSFVNYDQIKSRMKSMEKNTPNTYIHFITKGESLDKAILDSINKKQTFSMELYAKR